MQIRRLRASDDPHRFASGSLMLDRFLIDYAWSNQDSLGIGVTYVAPVENDVGGYITVAAASLQRDIAPPPDLRIYPRYPLPVLKIGRLAVDARIQGQGIGHALLTHSLAVAWAMRETVGCIGVCVDALPTAVPYYEHLGFIPQMQLEGLSGSRPRPTPMYLSLNQMSSFFA